MDGATDGSADVPELGASDGVSELGALDGTTTGAEVAVGVLLQAATAPPTTRVRTRAIRVRGIMACLL